jgi:hypothetical protein
MGSEFACNLGALTPTQRDRRVKLTAALAVSITSFRELDDGYAFAVHPDRKSPEIQEWIELENRCCPFLRLTLNEEPHGRILRIEGQGAKSMIQAELPELFRSGR